MLNYRTLHFKWDHLKWKMLLSLREKDKDKELKTQKQQAAYIFTDIELRKPAQPSCTVASTKSIPRFGV